MMANRLIATAEPVKAMGCMGGDEAERINLNERRLTLPDSTVAQGRKKPLTGRQS